MEQIPVRFTLSTNSETLNIVDKFIKRKHFKNRAEGFNTSVRKYDVLYESNLLVDFMYTIGLGLFLFIIGMGLSLWTSSLFFYIVTCLGGFYLIVLIFVFYKKYEGLKWHKGDVK